MADGKVLVTGGAGFIGSHVVELLLAQGYPVRVFDSLVDQVHLGAGPRYVPRDAEFVRGDVRDRETLSKALRGVDRIVHLAAEVGVGQSMYEISRYVEANTAGTGVLLDLIANERLSIERIVVASSMSIYGEGAYACQAHGAIAPLPRPEAQLRRGEWATLCTTCGAPLEPVATMEEKPLRPTSVYAISKMDQELLCLAVGAAYDIGVVALRYFNAYGPRQALSNPYTGVAAIFSSRLLNKKAPIAFEDGQQLRDFIHVSDIARATVLALEHAEVKGEAINVGVGNPLTISQVAEVLATHLTIDIAPEISGRFRAGDIRHCWAAPAKAEKLLGFRATVPFEQGVSELVEWVSTQEAEDKLAGAHAELGRRGLAR